MFKKIIICGIVATAIVCNVCISSTKTEQNSFLFLENAMAQSLTTGEIMSLPQGKYQNINGQLVYCVNEVTIIAYGNTGYAETYWWELGGYAIRSTPIYSTTSGSNSNSGGGQISAGYNPISQDISASLGGSGSSANQYYYKT
ncbi:hypothetical protein LX69_02673 [Breznakibacter xylanolyticus]|uniref:Uncharacterized protein n=1 Tax=Breznakibacter xylanolyticus TaxID=990 RepID=A0A2W7N517_9BACT|nr:hypothetical protein [Breznakibacter xylanolyticus]PZX13417.1 hypothetical protein LX69_02673 [Breznakibacter xylanolyticus]